MKYDVLNRFTGAVQFTAEIDCRETETRANKLRLAVFWAMKNRANLSGADLSGADLTSFKDDLWATLSQARAEVPALIAALREGRVDGSQYVGDCACLVGTLAKARGLEYRAAFPNCNASNPAERWFAMIHKGDKPGDETGGGFASAKALEWTLEWCAANGVTVPETTN